MLQFDGLAEDCNIFHFITTRQGGVSEGNYTSFNLGAYCGDNPAHVQENRKRLCNALHITSAALFIPHQTHGTTIRIINDAFLSASSIQQAEALEGVDALITAIPDVCIAVTTADCVPILLYAPDRQIVAVIHAGWRGSAKRITAQTVRTMIRIFGVDPAQVFAGIGPSISLQAFEVGYEVAEVFLTDASYNASICHNNPASGKPHIDLVEVNRQQLLESGLTPEHIELSGICTHSQNKDFYSARQLGIHSGRFLTGALLTTKTNL